MNVNHTRYGTEYTFDANNEWDQIAYVYFLWFQKQTPAEQEATRIWWFSKGNLYDIPDSGQSVLKSLLPSASEKTPSRTQGKRRKKNKGTTKGTGPLALQQLRKTNESNSYEGLRDYRDHKDY